MKYLLLFLFVSTSYAGMTTAIVQQVPVLNGNASYFAVHAYGISSDGSAKDIDFKDSASITKFNTLIACPMFNLVTANFWNCVIIFDGSTARSIQFISKNPVSVLVKSQPNVLQANPNNDATITDFNSKEPAVAAAISDIKTLIESQP